MWLTMWHGMIGVALIGAFFAIVGLVAYLLYGPGITITVPDIFGLNRATTTEETILIDPLADYTGTLFECDDKRSLKAELLASSVRLALSDGRALTLPQTLSASGVRFANTDESFVFQVNDRGASVEESGAVTYVNCVKKP